MEKAKQAAAAKEAAGLEAQVARLLEALSAVLEATKAQVEKRAALTFEEHQAELAEAEEVGVATRSGLPRARCEQPYCALGIAGGVDEENSEEERQESQLKSMLLSPDSLTQPCIHTAAGGGGGLRGGGRIHLQPAEAAHGLGRQAHPLLAVQAARAQPGAPPDAMRLHRPGAFPFAIYIM